MFYRDIGCGLLSATALAVFVASVGAQSIVRVDVRDEGEPPKPLAGGVQERQLTKFFDDVRWPGGVIYDAHWEAPATGLAGPVSVIMAYRAAGSRDVQRLIVRYPDGASGRQIARFRIDEEQIKQDGAVTAWRIELRQGDRILDERITGRWR